MDNNQNKGNKRFKRTAQSDISKTMGHNIRLLREKHGMTQQEIAIHLDVSYQQIQKYEAGKNRIPIESLIILKQLFNVSYDYFMKFEKAEEKSRDDMLLSAYLYNCIQKVIDQKERDKVTKVIDILCS